MRRIKVLSKKYDGSLREEYETYLYKETDDTITLFSPTGLNSWDHRKAAWIQAPDGLIEIYCTQRWYHVWHIAEQISNTNRIYVHIALPAMLKAQLLEWTDLDLDYQVHLNNSIELKDQAEFANNIERMRYPPQLVERAWAACREVEAGLINATFPFDHANQVDLYYWLKTKIRMDNDIT